MTDPIYGAPVSEKGKEMAGDACVRLCDGDPRKARTLWKIVVNDMGGYMPYAAAIALYRAAHTVNLVPDIEAPEVN